MPYLGTTTLHDVLDRAFGSQTRATPAELIQEAAGPGCVSAGTASRDRRGYEESILWIVLQIAEALAYVHAQGLCHGDLKPSNVLIGANGKPFLLDFNLSFDRWAQSRQPGGTFPYMSPEQLRSLGPEDTREPATADTRSDLFSLGVLAYEMLTGKNPFGPVPWGREFQETQTAWLQRQQLGPTPLRSLNFRVNRKAAAAIARCLAYDPEERPATVAELIQALRASMPRFAWLRAWLVHRRKPIALLFGTCLFALASVLLLLTLREPYGIRLLRQGQKAYEQKNYNEAVVLSTRSLEADPTLRQAYFARARAYQQLGCTLAQEIEPGDDSSKAKTLQIQSRTIFVQALQDYKNADPEGKDGRVLACRGFCIGKQDNHSDAIWFYTQAIEQGFAPATVFNNRGHSHLRLADLEAANKDLNEAVRHDPTLQAAFCNRAQLCLMRLLALRSSVTPVPRWKVIAYVEAGRKDIEKALQLGPMTADLYRDAAHLCLAVPPLEEAHINAALLYLEGAVECGLGPRELKSPLFDCLLGTSSYVALLKRSVSHKQPRMACLVVDPLGNETWQD
jgi:serine/threonine protein kinase